MPIANETPNCPKCGASMGTSPDGKEPVCRRCVIMNLMGETDDESSQEIEVTEPEAYEIHESIGRGGSGTIYRATEKKMGRVIALKLLNSAESEVATSKGRFLTEVRAVAALDHPNIVPIYATGELDGRLFFAMRYYSRGSLDTCLDEFIGQSRTAAALVAKVARALHHAHERGVLHRDIKPSNILLDEEGEPSITDFGLAKLEDGNSELTITGAVMGTPMYMSPEQAQGDSRAITIASDVYSLGTVLYQLLTGRPPFSGESSHTVLRSVVETDVEFTKSELSTTDRDLRTICLKCLEKDPARRYNSALAMAEDIGRWESGEPIRARPIKANERFRRWVRRHPWQMVALTALVVGSIASFALWRQAETARIVADHNADIAEEHASVAEENAYYAQVANALSEREQFDFGAARRTLANIAPERRGLEWRLVAGLCRGDEDWVATFSGATPRCVALNRATGLIMVLTGDRQLHALDPDSGQVEPAGRVPATSQVKEGTFIGDFHGMEFAPDGRHYFVVDGEHLMVVQTESGKVLGEPEIAMDTARWMSSDKIIFGRDSEFELIPAEPDLWEEAAWIFDLSDGSTQPLPPRGFTGPFAVSGDRAQVAVVRDHRNIEVYPAGSGFDGEPEVHHVAAGNVGSVEFSTDGKYLAVSGIRSDSTIITVLDLATDGQIFRQAWSRRTTLALCPDEPLLVATSREPWLRSWRFLEPYPDNSYYDDGENQAGNPHHLGGPFNPPLRLLTRSAQFERSGFLFGHEATPGPPVFLPGKRAFVTASDDGTVRRWPLASRVPYRQRLDMVETLYQWHHPAASSDGDLVLYKRRGTGHRLWNRRTSTYAIFAESEAGLAVLDDGRTLMRDRTTGEVICYGAILDDGRSPELWRADGGPNIGDYDQIIQSAVSADGSRIAVLQPGKIMVVDVDRRATWNTTDQGMEHGIIPGQCIDLSPDGNTIAVTGFEGRRVRLYDARDLALPFHKLVSNPEPTSPDSACAFSRDGARLFVGNEDGWVRVFDVVTRKELAAEKWKAHSTEISALAVSQRGEVVATAGSGAITLWSADVVADQPRRERLKLKTGTINRNWMQFGGGDTVLLHSAENYPIEAWETSTELRESTAGFPPSSGSAGAPQRSEFTYEFDTGLDGWENVQQSIWGSQRFAATKSVGGAFEPEYSGDGSLWAHPIPVRDDEHSLALWARSPVFALPGEALPEIHFSLIGGGRDTPAPAGELDPSLGIPSTADGWIGLVLRRVSDGRFILSATRNEGDHLSENFTWDASALREATLGDTPDERYTLDLIDTAHGPWGWIGLRRLSIDAAEEER